MKQIIVKSCQSCPYNDHYHGAGITYFCSFTDKITPEKGFLDDCRLEDVKEDSFLKKSIDKADELKQILRDGQRNMQIHAEALFDAVDSIFQKNSSGLSFGEFLKQIDAEAKKQGFEQESVTKDTGFQCWRHYFNDGISAEDAFLEDMRSGGMDEYMDITPLSDYGIKL